MKKFNILFLLLACFGLQNASAQTPYLDAQYDVQVTQNVIYGVNATILPVIAQQSAEALPRPLVMDIYEPVGDDANGERPVMLVYHTGNFLPFPANNGTGGTIRDSTVVEVCTRLAQRGYVAASVDYRLGWNPLAATQDERKFFLINAAYRGLQDGRTAARWFRRNAVDEGNTYNIDIDKIGQWGIGTGGYIAAGIATLDEYEEIVIPKFLIDLGGGPMPMVIEQINGNINGTSVGVVPPGYPVLPAGDTLNYPNNVTYADGTEISSEFAFTVNQGGAVGDLGWVDENVKPWVSFQVPDDPFAPYTTGVLTVPGTGDPADPADDFAVVEVSGAADIQAALNDLGTNAAFATMVDDGIEDFAEVANARSGGIPGLFPMPNNAAADGTSSAAPWDFYSPDIPTIPPNDPPNPELARTYYDTIFAYTAPRACIALGLGCNMVSDVEEVQEAADFGVKVAPNPTAGAFIVESNYDNPMLEVQLFDLSGRLVQNIAGIKQSIVRVERNSLPNGVYIAKLRFEEGIVTQKVMFE